LYGPPFRIIRRKDLFLMYGLKKTFFLLLILLCAFASLACSRSDQGPRAGQRPEVGGIAPDFTLRDLKGRNVSLSEYRGHVVVLDFWASWCPPCNETIPELVSVQNKYGGKGVVVLGIAIDDSRSDATTLLAFSKEHRMNYAILIGSDAVEGIYKIRSIPTLFLVDKKGKIQGLYMGYMENFRDIISAEIDKLI
jgi:cytochrome c biogenesis protein CcmG/thiol:disulfide interchange protein DsbE